jgi:hypothetical protein
MRILEIFILANLLDQIINMQMRVVYGPSSFSLIKFVFVFCVEKLGVNTINYGERQCFMHQIYYSSLYAKICCVFTLLKIKKMNVIM